MFPLHFPGGGDQASAWGEHKLGRSGKEIRNWTKETEGERVWKKGSFKVLFPSGKLFFNEHLLRKLISSNYH